MVRALHDAVRAVRSRPAASALAAADVGTPAESSSTSTTVALPPASPPRGTWADALTARRSSSGDFAPGPALGRDDLAAVLAAIGGGRHLATDVRVRGEGTRLTRLAVLARHVDGLPAGHYDHDAVGARLTRRGDAPSPAALQSAYLLHNYDLGQVAAVLVVLARPFAALDALGPRGYRQLGAEVGALAQDAYVTAADRGLACGVALGFDHRALRSHLGLTGGDVWPLLMVFVGHDRSRRAALRF